MGAAQDLPFGFSPQSGEFEDQFDPLKFEDDEFALGDDDLDFGDEHDGSLEPSSASGSQLVKKKRNNNRKGPQNADKRATHNAVERKRRESLNTRFIDLAKALPTTKHIKRPSKAVIVSKALDYVYDASAREHALTKENNELRCEVDQLRIRLGMPPLPPPVGLPEHRAATQATLRKALRQESTVPPESASSSSALVTQQQPQPQPQPTCYQAPTTPLDESPAGSSSSYLGAGAVAHTASPASIASATPSSAASALFDVTSPELASAVAYPAFFSTAAATTATATASSASDLGGSPAEVPLALGAGNVPSPCTSAPSFYSVPSSLSSAYAQQQHAQAQAQAHAAHAYSAALGGANPAVLGQFYAMQQQQQQPQFGGPAYLSPQVLLALQQQQAAHARAQAQAGFAAEWMSPLGASPPHSAASTGMFAASF